MTRRIGMLAAGLLIVSALGGVEGQTTATALFQEALMLERAEGKLREAATRYERIVADFPTERAVVPQALLQLGGVYEKLGRPDAREVYDRILRDHADAGRVATEARARLNALPGGPRVTVEGVVSKRLLSGASADRYGSVSRDGHFLSFIDRSTGDLAIRDLRTGSERRLTNNAPGSSEFAEYSVFSPDGARLAYGWHNSRGHYELRVIEREGGEPLQLYAPEGASWLMPYDWSPDGREILAILPREDRTRQLLFVSASDGAVRVLKTLDWNMGVPSKAQFSSDGRVVGYDRQSREPNSDSDVYMLSVDGSTERAVVDGPAEDVFLGWLPSGAVLFSSDRSGRGSTCTCPCRRTIT